MIWSFAASNYPSFLCFELWTTTRVKILYITIQFMSYIKIQLLQPLIIFFIGLIWLRLVCLYTWQKIEATRKKHTYALNWMMQNFTFWIVFLHSCMIWFTVVSIISCWECFLELKWKTFLRVHKPPSPMPINNNAPEIINILILIRNVSDTMTLQVHIHWAIYSDPFNHH